MKIHKATGFFQRFLGLMGKKDFPAGEALLFENCTAIHTCFMRFNLDISFLDEGGAILKEVRNLKPWRFAFGPKGTKSVLEMKSGANRASHGGV